LTETYSPAAIERAPATSPARAATRIGSRADCAADTPTTRLLVEISPSLAPSTAARSQPTCVVRCDSWCRRNARGDTSRLRARGAEDRPVVVARDGGQRVEVGRSHAGSR